MSWQAWQYRASGVPKRVQDCFEARDYYEDDLEALFKTTPKSQRPDIPSGLISSIINKSVSHVFPEGTALTATDEAVQPIIDSVVDSTGLLEKLGIIGREGHITGTVGLKASWNEFKQRWEMDIYPAEALMIDVNPLNADEILSVRIRFRFERIMSDGSAVTFWHQEQWTNEFYTEWEAQRETAGMLPDFSAAKITVQTENGYGEIPITIIRHELALDSPYGASAITHSLKTYARQLAISLSKVGTQSQFITNPAMKRINDTSKQPISWRPGVIIDISGQDNAPADFAPVTVEPTPESVFQFQRQLVDMAYHCAQVTSPSVEQEMKAGGTMSSVAWKAFNNAFVKQIRALRVRYGESGVEAFINMVLRMGAALGLPEYRAFSDPTQKHVQLVYPEFFEQTAEEKLTQIAVLKESALPSEELAAQIAQVVGIKRQEIIDAMAANLEEQRQVMIPRILGGGNAP